MTSMRIDTLHDFEATRRMLGNRSRSTLMRMKADGEIGYVKIRGRLFFEESEIVAYLDRQRRPAITSRNDEGPATTEPHVLTFADGSEARDVASD